MQYRFPHFVDRNVTADEGGEDVFAQRLFGVGRSEAGQRDEPSVPAAQPRALPYLGENEVEEGRGDRGAIRSWGGHQLGEGAFAAPRLTGS
jgi:hypothetical protein